jgi:hypothetical protein
MLVSINGTSVTVYLDGRSEIVYTFAPRIVDGQPVGLNAGFVGAGSDNSRGVWDDIVVQVAPPEQTLDRSATFTGGDDPFGDVASGAWVAAGGAYGATAPAAATVVSLADLGVSGFQTSSWIEVTATLRTAAMGGLVFDAYGLDRYKFVALDVPGQRVVFGHLDKGRWVIDAAAARALTATTDYTLMLTLKGTTASVTINGAFALSFAYNGAVADGALGLLARGGSATFDTARIRTNDAAFMGVPQVSIGDVTVTEGSAGTPGTATLTLTLSQAATTATTVNWATVSGSAVAGSDFVARSGVATFAAGATSATVTVTLAGDGVGESAESFGVVLSGGSGLTIARDAAVVTVTDDDVSFWVDDAVVNEGTSTVTVTVRRTGVLTGSASVTAATVAGTALAGSDFAAKTQTLTFAAGVSSMSFVVSIVNNTTAEPVETFSVALSAPTGGANIADGTGVVTINDNDGALLASAAGSGRAAAPVGGAELQRAFLRAQAAWLRVRPDADFSGVTVVAADLPDLMLGQAVGRVITVDTTAAGWGWQRMDLLSVLLHELGHVLGLEHEENGVMEAVLAPGERLRVPRRR